MNYKIPLATIALGALLFSCSKDARQVPVQIMLTDNPTAFDEVNVEITGIRVNLARDTGSWVSLNTKAGVYNLLKLQNGIMDTLATGTAPEGTLKEVRFVLGSKNSVKVNGVSSPLVIPSGAESGLKVKIDKDLKKTLNTFVLDFDAALSIKEESDGYKLRPVIRLK